MAFVTMLLEDTPLWLLGLFLFVIFWLAAAFGRWLRSKTTQTGDKSDPALIYPLRRGGRQVQAAENRALFSCAEACPGFS